MWSHYILFCLGAQRKLPKPFETLEVCGLEFLPAPFELLLNLRQRGVLHFLQRQAMRLERSVPPQMIGDDIRVVSRLVPRRIVEHIARSYQFSIGELKAERDHARRTIKA